MHCQRDLFRPMCARQHHRQVNLFDQSAATDAESDLRCEVCGQFLVRTESGFLCCPNGHGKLLIEELDDDSERSGRWFDDGPPEPPPAFSPSTMRYHARKLRASH